MTWEEIRYELIKTILGGYHNNGYDRAHERIMICCCLTESTSQEEAYAKISERYSNSLESLYQHYANKLAPK